MRFHSSAVSTSITRKRLCIVLACATVSVLSMRAYADAADPGTVTITAPRESVVDHDITLAPIIELKSTARVPYVPVTLTTNSGVALLKDRVATAARQMCADMDPLGAQDWSCVHRAVEDAQPQIQAAIERAEDAERRVLANL